jgi:hypothetical protein
MYAPQVALITSALSRCSTLLPGGSAANTTTQQLLDSMLSRMMEDNARLLWQGAQGASVSVLMHALARMGYSGGRQAGAASAAAAARQTTQQLCRIIANDPGRLHVRQLATAAWALGRISRRHPQLKKKRAVAAALKTISREAVARKLWLRPHSMTGLLTASVWLGRKDVALFDAVCEVRGSGCGDKALKLPSHRQKQVRQLELWQIATGFGGATWLRCVHTNALIFRWKEAVCICSMQIKHCTA